VSLWVAREGRNRATHPPALLFLGVIVAVGTGEAICVGSAVFVGEKVVVPEGRGEFTVSNCGDCEFISIF